MKKSPELVKKTRQIYESLYAIDEEAIADMFSKKADIFAIGADTKEFWKGRDTIIPNFINEMKNIKGARVVETNIRAFEHGDTGWIVDQPLIKWNDSYITFRITIVFIKERGDWRIVLWQDAQIFNQPA